MNRSECFFSCINNRLSSSTSLLRCSTTNQQENSQLNNQLTKKRRLSAVQEKLQINQSCHAGKSSKLSDNRSLLKWLPGGRVLPMTSLQIQNCRRGTAEFIISLLMPCACFIFLSSATSLQFSPTLEDFHQNCCHTVKLSPPPTV